MRILIPLLLLTTAAPAYAAEPDGEQPQTAREARSERPSLGERIMRAQRAERPVRSYEEPRQTRQVEVEPSSRAERSGRMAEPTGIEAPVARAIERERSRDSVRDWRSEERNAERSRRAGEAGTAPGAPVMGEALRRERRSADSVQSRDDDRQIGRALRNRIATEGWRREWRQDRRFDWRHHRYRDRNRFRLGIYIDPFGWNYRRWNIGWNLPYRHYARDYWIHDPFYYRLPPVYGPYRWVRYWDDALLVDLRTGRVVDVIHNFFW